MTLRCVSWGGKSKAEAETETSEIGEFSSITSLNSSKTTAIICLLIYLVI